MSRKYFWIAGLLTVVFTAQLSVSGAGTRTRSGEGFKVTGTPWGPTQKEYDGVRRRLASSKQITSEIRSNNYRMLRLEAVERTDGEKRALPPTHFRAYFYDYSSGRTYLATGDFAGVETIRVDRSPVAPDVSPTYEEIEDAFKIIASDPVFGAGVRDMRLELFPPMPPLTYKDGERLVNIGIRDTGTGNERIIGVSFKDRKVVEYGSDAPKINVTGGSCGIQNSGQGSSTAGVGTLSLESSIQGQVIWQMLVVRPAMSSGRLGEGSGIEVRDVRYKGKSVLKRGHAPILNVKYHPGGCGSFRDWQNAEGFFSAPSAGSQNPLPGYRILAEGEVAQTVVESGSDIGDFQGVAIYQQDVGLGTELVLVSEMNAGWYRYIMEWRFAADGTIRPRYGFGSVSNGCVCAPRDHHVYWRFDFDIVNPANKVFKVERGRKFLSPITTESKLFRSYQTNKALLIQNSAGDEAYQLVPNITDEEAYFRFPDGTLETFGAGDLWVLQYSGTTGTPGELDDPNTSNAANIDPWVNDQPIGGNDVVVWYGAHQFRNDASSLTNFDRSGLALNGIHTVGPDLRAVRW